MKNNIPGYTRLAENFQRITHLGNIAGLAHWDAATNLPAGSAASRQQEMSTLSSVIHEMETSKEVGLLINDAISEFDHLDDWQRSNLAKIKKTYDKSTCIDSKTQQEASLAASECEFKWRSARQDNDFASLEPYLDKVFDSTRKVASMQSKTLKKSPYDVLIDSYDPDRSSAEINLTFDRLKLELPNLVNKIMQKQQNEKVIPLSEKIDEATQKAIGLKIMQKMEFNMDMGRLDKSTHPFCIGSNDDVRLTTRYDENNFLSSLFGVIHEAGHGLYQQNLPAQYRNQPVGSAKGMAFHESQSLIMEMQAGTSREFMEFLAGMLRDEFAFKGKEYSAENLYKLVTRVKPSFIRVDADEVTYPLHIIMRYEIEQAIIEGNLKAAELPSLWNEKMQEYLGILPDTDANGCLQDIHWPSGLLGYFPSYTNGAIIASMLMQSAKEKYGSINKELSEGKFTNLNKYLNDNLRRVGCSKISTDLLKFSTGFEQPNTDIFVRYLNAKYL